MPEIKCLETMDEAIDKAITAVNLANGKDRPVTASKMRALMKVSK